MSNLDLDQILASLATYEHDQDIESVLHLIQPLPRHVLADSGWELLPGLYPYVDKCERIRSIWTMILSDSSATEIILSLNQLLHGDFTIHSPRILFNAYSETLRRLSSRPSRLSNIKQDLFNSVRSLLHNVWKDNGDVVCELVRFTEEYLDDRSGLELALDLLSYRHNNEKFISKISLHLSLSDAISISSLQSESIPGLCLIIIYHLRQLQTSHHKFDFDDHFGSSFLRRCSTLISLHRHDILFEFIDVMLPLLTGWSCSQISDLMNLMEVLIPITALNSARSRLPSQILSVIGSDHCLIQLTLSTQRSRPYLASTCLRVLKDRLSCSDSRDDSLLSSLRSVITTIISDYHPDLGLGSANFDQELSYLDVISISFNIAIYLSISHRINIDLRLIRSCQDQLSLLLNAFQIHAQILSDPDRLHSGRMQIRLVESVADRLLQILECK